MLAPGLYIVATPIGNLDDISKRALSILQQVDIIAAEDTRHSQKLLSHFHISTPLISYHDYNETTQAKKLVAVLKTNKAVALISDAGTPLISDPGYKLVAYAREQGIKVIPIPGPCACIAALSVSGLPTDKFLFAGFLPAKAKAKETKLQELLSQEPTLIFYESSQRIVATLQAIKRILAAMPRKIVLAREITKKYETIIHGDIDQILNIVAGDAEQQKGEIVLMIEGNKLQPIINAEIEHIIATLCEELPLKQAVTIASKLTHIKKNIIYQYALELKTSPPSDI